MSSCPKYTVAPGRAILRDGKPFVHLTRDLDANGGAAFAPTVADNFAHTVVRAMNARCKKGRR